MEVCWIDGFFRAWLHRMFLLLGLRAQDFFDWVVMKKGGGAATGGGEEPAQAIGY